MEGELRQLIAEVERRARVGEESGEAAAGATVRELREKEGARIEQLRKDLLDACAQRARASAEVTILTAEHFLFF